MNMWAKGGFVLIGALAVVAATVGVARERWVRSTARMVRRLGAGGARGATFSPNELDGLPAPVARYLAFALRPGQRLVTRTTLEQRGEFATRPDAWGPFTATQQVAVFPPGFVWDARIRMAPLVVAHVRDSYVDGVGTMQGALAAIVPVVDQRGTPEMAAGELQRYLSETPWTPTALLPSAGVTWSAIDDSTARATITDRGTAVWIDFHFGARGEIVGLSTVRYRDVDGTPVATPWVGRFWDYGRVDGMMIPRQGEVAWVLPTGRQPYWRGRLTRVSYDPTA